MVRPERKIWQKNLKLSENKFPHLVVETSRGSLWRGDSGSCGRHPSDFHHLRLRKDTVSYFSFLTAIIKLKYSENIWIIAVSLNTIPHVRPTAPASKSRRICPQFSRPTRRGCSHFRRFKKKQLATRSVCTSQHQRVRLCSTATIRCSVCLTTELFSYAWIHRISTL